MYVLLRRAVKLRPTLSSWLSGCSMSFSGLNMPRVSCYPSMQENLIFLFIFQVNCVLIRHDKTIEQENRSAIIDWCLSGRLSIKLLSWITFQKQQIILSIINLNRRIRLIRNNSRCRQLQTSFSLASNAWLKPNRSHPRQILVKAQFHPFHSVQSC